MYWSCQLIHESRDESFIFMIGICERHVAWSDDRSDDRDDDENEGEDVEGFFVKDVLELWDPPRNLFHQLMMCFSLGHDDSVFTEAETRTAALQRNPNHCLAIDQKNYCN